MSETDIDIITDKIAAISEIKGRIDTGSSISVELMSKLLDGYIADLKVLLNERTHMRGFL